jgi:hypothetical protein
MNGSDHAGGSYFIGAVEHQPVNQNLVVVLTQPRRPLGRFGRLRVRPQPIAGDADFAERGIVDGLEEAAGLKLFPFEGFAPVSESAPSGCRAFGLRDR